MGFDGIGFHAVGELIFGAPPPLYILPVSRISSGGTYRRPANVPTVYDGINWNDGSIILWNDDTPMYWN